MDNTRDADATWLRKTLQARGDIDAVTVDLLAVDHHVAEIYADTELHLAFGWQVRILSLKSTLDLGRTIHCLDYAGEFCQYAVAGGIYEPAVMLLDEAVDNLAMGRESLKGRLFIFSHEAAVTVDISTENSGELTFHH